MKSNMSMNQDVVMSWLFFKGSSNNRCTLSTHIKNNPALPDTGWKLWSWVTFSLARFIYLSISKVLVFLYWERRSDAFTWMTALSFLVLHEFYIIWMQFVSSGSLFTFWRFFGCFLYKWNCTSDYNAVLRWVFLSRVWNAPAKQNLFIYFAHGCYRYIIPIAYESCSSAWLRNQEFIQIE